MRALIYAFSGAIAIGALGGWLAAGGGGGASQNNDTAWSLTDRPVSGDAERMKIFMALLGTGHFGETTSATPEQDPSADEKVPLIAAGYIKDGELSFSFYGLDGAFVTAGVGDALPGGWVIQDASLETVIVERNGEIHEISVFQHDNPGI